MLIVNEVKIGCNPGTNPICKTTPIHLLNVEHEGCPSLPLATFHNIWLTLAQPLDLSAGLDLWNLG